MAFGFLDTYGAALPATTEQFKPEDGTSSQARARGVPCASLISRSPLEIPAIAEPLFMGLQASLEFVPVMNVDDLRSGLGEDTEGL